MPRDPRMVFKCDTLSILDNIEITLEWSVDSLKGHVSHWYSLIFIYFAFSLQIFESSSLVE